MSLTRQVKSSLQRNSSQWTVDIAEEAQSIIQAHRRKYNPEESDENYLYKDQHTVLHTRNPKP